MENADLISRDLSFFKNIILSEKGNERNEITLFDFFPCYIYNYNAKASRITFINKKMAERLGYAREELVGQSGLQDLFITTMRLTLLLNYNYSKN
ncbi:MAG: hypothetical protein JWQ96_3092 [Segetibacter sp.]|nr:hypothetical protein [Segetibacter sp.]